METEVLTEAAIEQRKLKADLEVYEAKQKAEILRIEAESKLFVAQKEAEGVKAKGDAEAAAIQAKGEAEAAAVKAKGIAEANAMNEKAKAFKEYNDAAVIDTLANVLPAMAKEIAQPLATLKDVHVYGTTGQEMTGLSGNIPAVIKQTFDVMESVTGVKLGRIAQENSTVIAADANLHQ